MKNSGKEMGRTRKPVSSAAVILKNLSESQSVKIAVKWPQTGRGISMYAEKMQAIFKKGLKGVSEIFGFKRYRKKTETGIFSIISGVMQKIPAPFSGPAKKHGAQGDRGGQC
jgi:hypothetical protein